MGSVGNRYFAPILAGQADGLQPREQVLFDAGEGEDGAPAGDFLPDRVHGLERGEGDLDVRFDVEHEPADRPVSSRGCERPLAEVFGVGENSGAS